MKCGTAAAIAFITVMAASVSAFYKNDKLQVQEKSGLTAEMEVLEEEMAAMMVELEDDTAYMQGGVKKHQRGLTRREKQIRRQTKWAKEVKKKVRDLETSKSGPIYYDRGPSNKHQSDNGPFTFNNIRALLPKKSPPCNSDFPELTLQKLTKLVSSMTENSYRVSYAYVDPQQATCKGKFYSSGCDNNCSPGRSDSEMKLIDDCSNAREYWSGWSPCVSCVKNLAKFYDEQHVRNFEYTIYIGKQYIDKKNTQNNRRNNYHFTLRYRDCLSYLLSKGFILEPWDWDLFSTRVGIKKGSPCYRKVQEAKRDIGKINSVSKDINIAETGAQTVSQEQLRRACTK